MTEDQRNKRNKRHRSLIKLRALLKIWDDYKDVKLPKISGLKLDEVETTNLQFGWAMIEIVQEIMESIKELYKDDDNG